MTIHSIAPNPLVANLGLWIDVNDTLPIAGRSVNVWRRYGYVGATDHPACGREDGIEESSLLTDGIRGSFCCEVASGGMVTHWLDAPPLGADELLAIQALLRKPPSPSPVVTNGDTAILDAVRRAIEEDD